MVRVKVKIGHSGKVIFRLTIIYIVSVAILIA